MGMAGAGEMPSSCCVRIGICVSAVFGLLFLGLGAAVSSECSRFTPIYQNVTCLPTAVRVNDIRVAPPSGFTLEVDIGCRNPNPYDLVVSPGEGEQGRVALDSPTAFISLVDATKTNVRSRDGDTARTSTLLLSSTIEQQLFSFSTLSIGSTILGGPFKIYFELRLHVVVQPVMLMFLTPLKIDIPVREACGLEVQLLPEAANGDVVCGETFAALDVPPLEEVTQRDTEGDTQDDTQKNTQNDTESDMQSTTRKNTQNGARQKAGPVTEGLTPEIAPETLEEAEEGRERLCGPAPPILFGVGSSLMALAAGLLTLQVARLRRKVHNKDATEEATNVQPASIGISH